MTNYLIYEKYLIFKLKKFSTSQKIEKQGTTDLAFTLVKLLLIIKTTISAKRRMMVLMIGFAGIYPYNYYKNHYDYQVVEVFVKYLLHGFISVFLLRFFF